MDTRADNMAGVQADEVKACCAAAYASDWARHLLGESFHPGGLLLTKRLGTLLDLGPGKHLLDVAAGKGASAIFLAQQFGCEVNGVEYGMASLMPSSANAPSVPFRTKLLLPKSSPACCGLVAAWV